MHVISKQIQEHATSLAPEMETALLAAQAAGAIIREGSGKLNLVEEKGVGDLVSEVDRNADRAAEEVLSSRSDLPILSEELNSDADQEPDLWIVDPLDASSAFLMQAGPQYPAVLVALRQAGQIKLGVAFFPLTNDWCYAVRGRGAYLNAKRLICDGDESLSEVWVEMNQYGSAQLETPFFAQVRERLRSTAGARLVTTDVPHSGVAIRIASGESSLAAAIHDNNPQEVKQGPWDIAAPQVILEEAGGVFLNPRGEPTDPFSAEPIIVAKSMQLAQRIIDLSRQAPV